MTQDLSFLGFGIGLRPDHYQTIVEFRPQIDWLEIVSEDFIVDGGLPLQHLDKICEHYPIVMHGVSLSIGGSDPLDWEYLRKLKILMERVQPKWVSDHFCWTGVSGVNLHGLLPMPFTEEAVNHTVERILLLPSVALFNSPHPNPLPQGERGLFYITRWHKE